MTADLLTNVQQRSRSDQKELYGWLYFRRLLRWQHCWSTAHQERDKEGPLPGALDRFDHQVSVSTILSHSSTRDANSCSYCITIVASVALYIVLSRENKKREGHSGNEEERDRVAFLDLTDGKNPYFRYVL